MLSSNILSELVPGLSQPVWGPEISTVGAYSREGYTSRTFDTPIIPFRKQVEALEIDEDVQLAINDLASKVTGGEHYITTDSDEVQDHLDKFSHDIHFDTFDTILVKELLWYGNSVWKPRMGIANVKSFDDLMHIPIGSFVRIWWDRQRIPYKYEFRGAEYQGYHNPGEIIHFKWNPINASVFGTGFGVSVTSPRNFTLPISSTQVEDVQLPSMLDRKYATQFVMQMAEQRYVSRNVWTAEDASVEERAALQRNIDGLEVGQDIVTGSAVDVKELGSQGRNFNAAQFADITQGSIFKALNDFRGKQAGESTQTYANAERAALLDELGLTAFPISVRRQLEEKLFRPWYDANPVYSMSYMGGMIPIPWQDIKFDINFGQVEKKDVPVADMIKLIDLYLKTPIIKDPKQIIKLFEQAGLPVQDGYVESLDQMYNDPAGEMALGNIQPHLPPHSDIGGGEIPEFDNYMMGTTPMDDPMFDSMIKDVRGGNPFVSTNYYQSNKSQSWKDGRDYE